LVMGGGISESRAGLLGRSTRAHNRRIKPRSNFIDFQPKIDNLDLTLPSAPHPSRSASAAVCRIFPCQ
jgi:hypothetical protein